MRSSKDYLQQQKHQSVNAIILYPAVRVVSNTSKIHRIFHPVLKSMHWLQITERIKHEILSVLPTMPSSDYSKQLHHSFFFCEYSQTSLQQLSSKNFQ